MTVEELREQVCNEMNESIDSFVDNDNTYRVIDSPTYMADYQIVNTGKWSDRLELDCIKLPGFKEIVSLLENKRPFYPSYVNHHCGDCLKVFDTFKDFYEVSMNLDIDYNLIYMFHISKYAFNSKEFRSEYKVKFRKDEDGYHKVLTLLTIKQRKGIYYPVIIKEIKLEDYELLFKILYRNNKRLLEYWKGFENV